MRIALQNLPFDPQLGEAVESAVGNVFQEVRDHRSGNHIAHVLGILEGLCGDAHDLPVIDRRSPAVAGFSIFMTLAPKSPSN